jgi:hypothetical protein
MSIVATVPANVIRFNLDGQPFSPLYRPLDQLYDKAVELGLTTPDAPVEIASATWSSTETVVGIYDGGTRGWLILYAGDSAGHTMFDFYKNTFIKPDAWGSGQDGSIIGQNNGTLYEIYATNIPGAAALAGICAATV